MLQEMFSHWFSFHILNLRFICTVPLTLKTRGGASDIENEALNYDRPIHDTNMNASINVASVLFLFTIVNPCTSYRVHHVANLLDEETFYPHIKRTIDSQAHNTIVKLKTHHFGIEPSE
jgi:hypothetical protein